MLERRLDGADTLVTDPPRGNSTLLQNPHPFQPAIYMPVLFEQVRQFKSNFGFLLYYCAE